MRFFDGRHQPFLGPGKQSGRTDRPPPRSPECSSRPSRTRFCQLPTTALPTQAAKPLIPGSGSASARTLRGPKQIGASGKIATRPRGRTREAVCQRRATTPEQNIPSWCQARHRPSLARTTRRLLSRLLRPNCPHHNPSARQDYVRFSWICSNAILTQLNKGRARSPKESLPPGEPKGPAP